MSDNWIYLSHFYNEQTPGYGGKDDFHFTPDKCIDYGHSCNQHKISMSNHVGTHIDLPFHFFNNGKKLEHYQPNDWFFNHIIFLDIKKSSNELLTSSDLPTFDKNADCLIIRTGFESFRNEKKYWEENPGLTDELANFLKANYKKLRMIGFDFISASAYQNREMGKKAHQAFLGEDQGPAILILEDMKLSAIEKGESIVKIYLAPLLISGADGVPATVSALMQ